METIQCHRRNKEPPNMAAVKKFRGYKHESKKTLRSAELNADPILRRISALFRECLEIDTGVSSFEDHSKAAASGVNGLESVYYTPEDVERFTLSLTEFQHHDNFIHRAGLFLSYLINDGAHDRYVIQTSHLSERLECIGYLNTKNIIIEGPAGNSVGLGMIKGSIIVRGDADGFVGKEMRGGELTVTGNVGTLMGWRMRGGHVFVHGNAGNRVGKWMFGGRITIKGNAGEGFGEIMHGGELHIAGDFVNLGYVFGGKIFHKGELVRDVTYKD
jgi:hypothetical protein